MQIGFFSFFTPPSNFLSPASKHMFQICQSKTKNTRRFFFFYSVTPFVSKTIAQLKEKIKVFLMRENPSIKMTSIFVISMTLKHGRSHVHTVSPIPFRTSLSPGPKKKIKNIYSTEMSRPITKD